MKLIIPLFSLLFSLGAFAQTEIVPNSQKELQTTEIKVEGWIPSLKAGLNLSFGSSQRVIGQPDGDTISYAFNMDGSYNYKRDRNEWRNVLNLNQGQTKTPTIPRYVKSADLFKFETIFLRSLEDYPRLGPYARASVEAPIFFGEDVRQGPVSYVVPGVGTVTESSYGLTEGFKPLTTKQSIGVFAKIYAKPDNKMEARLGVGTQQVSADDQLAIDSATATTVTLKELASYDQAGVELGWTWAGQLNPETAYDLSAEAFIPVDNDFVAAAGQEDKDAFELTNYDLKAKLTNKVSNYLNIGYEVKLKSQPQLQNDAQITSMLTFNFNQVIF